MLIIPYYNECQRIDQQAFEDCLEQYPNIDFLFVNDGSTDNSKTILKVLWDRYTNRVHFYDLPHNQGKGEAVRQGLKLAFDKHHGHEYIGFWDMDLATPLSEAPRFLEIFERYPKVHFVLGSRILKLGSNIERSALRHYLGRIFATFASLALRLPVYDTQCGAKMMRREIVPTLTQRPFVSPWFFDVEMLFRAKTITGAEHYHDFFREATLLECIDKKGSKVRFTDALRAPLDMIRIALEYRK